MGFADYKKNRTPLEDMLKKTAALNNSTKNYEADPLDWYPTTGKDGNAKVVVRFMPAREDEDSPFVRRWTHAFQNPDTQRWYIENCLSTLDPSFSGSHPDPVMEYNQKLWAAATKAVGKDDAKNHPLAKQAGKQKRNTEFRSNIYVVSDSHKPDANGSLRKWKYTQQIFNELTKAMNPPKIEGAETDDPIDPFDLIEGANLQITITTDPTKKSDNGKPVRAYAFKWLKQGPLADDKHLEVLWNELNGDKKWSLSAYIAPDQFKSYDDLRKHLTKVIGYDPLAESKPITGISLKPVPASPAPVSKAAEAVDASATDSFDDEFLASLESNA
jgi:hypothetical protein